MCRDKHELVQELQSNEVTFGVALIEPLFAFIPESLVLRIGDEPSGKAVAGPRENKSYQ